MGEIFPFELLSAQGGASVAKLNGCQEMKRIWVLRRALWQLIPAHWQPTHAGPPVTKSAAAAAAAEAVFAIDFTAMNPSPSIALDVLRQLVTHLLHENSEAVNVTFKRNDGTARG